MKKLLFLGLFVGYTYAGQGMYLDINSYASNSSLKLDSSSCMSQLPNPSLNQRQYVEADDSWSCLFRKSTFSISLWKQNTKLASYTFTLSAEGSTLKDTFLNNNYSIQSILYPHYGLISSQDVASISVTAQNTQSWIGNLNPALKLSQLFLPGTHDSGTSAISSNSSITPDASSEIADAFKIFPSLIAYWSKAQNNNILAQLNSGVRYFDLRLCGTSNINSIYTCHAVTGEKLTDIVNEVKTFTTNHPREIVILDLNHWYNSDNNLDQMRTNVASYLLNNLGNQIASRSNYTTSSELADFWAGDKSIIISSDNTQGNSTLWQSVNSSNINACNYSTDICSFWPNAADIPTLETSLTSAIDNLKTNSHNYLFVVQTQLTPSVQTILDGLTSTSPGSLLSLTGTYKYNVYKYLNTTGLLNNLSGLIFIEDFSNGIDLMQFSLSHINGVNIY